jgi:cytochrome b6-f complex iron-sulfur subunit
MAGEGDPAIQALLRAATARGGNAGLLKRSESVPDAVAATRKQDPRNLPPDARMAKVVEAAQKAKSDPDAKRRAVVSGGALALGWTAFAAGGGLATVAGVRFAVPNVLEEPDPRVRVGKLQRYLEMQPGEVNEDFKNQGLWMIREEERIAALSIICTHLGCIPNWLPNDRKFKCPCHGSGYRADGVNFEGPTPRPLERFRVFVVEGIVIVDKSKKYQHELGQWDQPGSFVSV